MKYTLNKTHSTTLLVVFLLFGAKFLGFVKNIFLAISYGTSIISDAYQMAIAIPSILLGVVLYSNQAFTKGYFEAEKRGDGKEIQYVNTFINFIIILLILITGLILICEDKLIRIFAPGFNESTVICTQYLLKPIVFGVAFLGIATVFSEYLRCRNSFVFAQCAYLVINIVEIVTLLFSIYFGYLWLAYGFLIANGMYLLVVVIVCVNKGYRYKFIINRDDVKLFIPIFFPVFISCMITEINQMVDKMFASLFETGVMSSLGYAMNIRTVALIIAAGYISVIYPKLAKAYADEKFESFKYIVSKSILMFTVLYLILTVGIIIFSDWIIRIVYYRGAFNIEALKMTSQSLIMYAIGLMGIAIRDILIKALYCMEKGKAVIIFSAISVVINIILNYILSEKIGYVGLPLATSLSVIIVLPFLFLFYKSNICKHA